MQLFVEEIKYSVSYSEGDDLNPGIFHLSCDEVECSLINATTIK